MKRFPRLMLVAAMLIFGSVAIFRKGVAMPSPEIAMFRGLVGAGGLWLLQRLSGQKMDHAAIKRNFVKLAGAGMLVGINWVLLFEAYRYTTVGVATLCYYMSPIFVILLSPMVLKEKLTPWKGLCAAVAFIGMGLVSGVLESGTAFTGERQWLGIALGLGDAVLYAACVLISKTIRGMAPYDTTITEMTFAGLVMVPYILLTGGFHLQFDTVSVINLLILCLVHTGLAYALYFAALKQLPAQTISLFSYIDPVSAVVFAYLFLGETLTVLQLAGGVILIAAAIFSETGPRLRLGRGKEQSEG